MKMSPDSRLPISDDPIFLKQRLDEIYRLLATQLNGVTEGRASVLHAATDLIPDNTYGADGDFVHKKTKSITTGVLFKYVVQGWDKVGGVWIERWTVTP